MPDAGATTRVAFAKRRTSDVGDRPSDHSRSACSGRAVPAGYGKQMGLSVYTPIIVKYRDDKTDLSTTLEEVLR